VTLPHSCDSRARNCWTRLKTHGPFEEYNPPQPGVSYLIPHYRCSTCGHKVSLIAGAFLRPVDGAHVDELPAKRPLLSSRSK
jgi:hypothetical protein